MKYASLGRSGLQVSRLCLGTWNFGSYTDERSAFRMMDAALDAGINFFDTANCYPHEAHAGAAEEIIGRWFAQGGGRREKVVLATKVYQPLNDPHDGPNNAGGLSKYKILRHLEGSLRRLQTDHIDIYQMHHIDRNAQWDELWEAYETLIYQGRIGYAGSSNFAGWHLAVAQAAAARRNLFGLVSEQHKYNLVCRLPELEVLPAARNLGIGVLAWSPLEGGLFGGSVAAQGSRTERRKQAAAKYRPQLDAFADFCRERHKPEAEVALAWVLRHAAISAAVIGPRTVTQLEQNILAAHLRLDEEMAGLLNEIFPGPGGESPEAYAW